MYSVKSVPARSTIHIHSLQHVGLRVIRDTATIAEEISNATEQLRERERRRERGRVKRPEVGEVILNEVHDVFLKNLSRAIAKNGRGAYASVHETYGVIAEEMQEFLETLRSNNLHAVDQLERELLDIAVAAFWGVASIGRHRVDTEPLHPNSSEEQGEE